MLGKRERFGWVFYFFFKFLKDVGGQGINKNIFFLIIPAYMEHMAVYFNKEGFFYSPIISSRHNEISEEGV